MTQLTARHVSSLLTKIRKILSSVFLSGGCALLLPLTAVASPAQTVAGRFVDALTRDDLQLLASVVAEREPEPRAWSELRETIETYDCIEVRRAGWSVEAESADTVALRLDLDAAGTLKAAWRPVRQLPRWWYVDARRTGTEWKIEGAMTAERRLANAMAAAPAGEAARMFAAASGLDPARTLSAYAMVPSVDASVPRLDAAIPLAQAIGDIGSEMLMRRNRAHALLATSAAGAVAAARETVQLARAHGTLDVVASALLTAGYVEAMAERPEAAAATFAAGAALHDRVDDPMPALKSLFMLGWLHTTGGDQLQVLAATEKLAELAGHYGWEEGQENALLKRAELHHDLGSFDVARKVYRQAIRTSASRGNRKLVAFGSHNLAGLELMEKNWDTAIELLRGVRENHSESTTLLFSTSSRLFTGLTGKKAYAEAEAVLRDAEIVVRTGYASETALQEAILRLHWSELRLLQGEPEEAIELARQAIATSLPAKANSRLVRFGGRHILGRALRAAGRPAEAVVALQEAVAMTEEEIRDRADPLSSATYLESNLRAYAELIDLLAGQNRVEEAFRVAEQMKGRALRETLDRGRIDRSASMSPEERAREQALDAHVEELNRGILEARTRGQSPDALSGQLAAARGELDAFRVEMRLKHPAVGRRRIAIPAALPRIAAEVAVVEYVLGEESTIAFVLTRKGVETSIETVRLPVARATVERDAARAAHLVSVRSPRYRASAERLYAALVAPLEPLLAGAKTLCIVPDGALWSVPFHALPVDGERDLIDRHAVFYAHSLALLGSSTRPARGANAAMIAFGNPAISNSARTTLRSAFRDVTLGTLADAETEVRALSRMYPPERSRVYYGNAATEDAFKRETPSFGIIHVAAHALVDDRSPMYSAIVLAAHDAGNDSGDDGLLEAREVADLELDAELAVLSACETGRGKVRHGEGVVGLSWAFSAAGCPTTLVSQWRAESKATAKLMVEFHRRLLLGDSTAEALRTAQLAVRRTAAYRHPFYWAPFVAVGAGDRKVALAAFGGTGAAPPPAGW